MPDPHNQITAIEDREVTFRLAATKYRWLKRLTKAGLALVLAMTVVRLLWGWEAERRLRATIEKCVARGGPVFAEDFDALAGAVPDEDNAAILYEQAIEKTVRALESGTTFLSFLQDPEWFESNATEAAELMRVNTQAFALVRQARDRALLAWSEPLAGQTTREPTSRTSGQRELTRALIFSAEYLIHNGRASEAVESAHDLVALGDTIAARALLLDGYMGWAVQAGAFACVEDALPHLPHSTGPTSGASNSDTDTRQRVRLFISHLLEDRFVRKRFRNSFLGSRAYDLERVKEMERGNYPDLPPRGRLYTSVARTPLAKFDLARALRSWSVCAVAASEPSFPGFLSHFPAVDGLRSTSLVRSVAFPYTEGGAWYHAFAAGQFFRQLTRRRMAAVALAIWLHESDHGQRPLDLDALVPEYLPVLPVDPLSPDGGGFLYAPDATQPCIYSVGPDGEDDGGDFKRSTRRYWWRNEVDEPFYLDGRPDPGSTGGGATTRRWQ